MHDSTIKNNSEHFNNTQSQENINEKQIVSLNKNQEFNGTHKYLRSAQLSISNSNLNLDENLDSNYHQVYLMPEEIFLMYISQDSLLDSHLFLERLAQAHEVEDTRKNHILLLANLILTYLESEKIQNSKKDITFADFNKYLKNENIYHLAKDNTTNKAISFIFNNKKDIDKMSLEETPGAVIRYQDIKNTLLGIFQLNEEVKKILHEAQNQSRKTESVDVATLISNAIYNQNYTKLKDMDMVKSRLEGSKDMLLDILTEQTILHNLIQGIINKDKTLFFIGLDMYVKDYLKKEGRTDSKLNLSDIITLFFSDYFTELQNPASTIQEKLFAIMLSHYDREIFNEFLNKYSIPKNIVIRIYEDEDTYYVSPMEYALILGKSEIIPELISFGFKAEPFTEKIIETDTLHNYKYVPYQHLTEFIEKRMFTEQHLLDLIKNNLITSSFVVNYNEAQELVTNNDITYKKVNKNIFYYLAHEQFNEAFILLYEKSKYESKNDFNLKNVVTEYTNEDLLAYYLKYVKINNTYNFDTNIFDILINEKYTIEQSKYDNSLNSIEVLQDYEPEMMVDVVQYLASIFSDNFKVKKEIPINKLSQSTANMVSWFNKAQLEIHYKNVEKNKESFSQDYIKQMLSKNNHLKPNLIIDDETIFDQLLAEFPNFEEVIRFYKSQFRLKKLSGKSRINPILLLGEPGIGKTHFAKKLAQYLNTGYTFIDMASLTANWILTGNNATWKGAKQGKVLEAIMNSPTINPIVLMDELEKAKGGEYDPTMSLYQLLEETNAVSFTDEFIDFPFDASNIMYIACANSLGNLSEPLQTRFKIIKVPKPNSEQTAMIIQNIYKEIIHNTNIFNPTLSDEIVDLIKTHSLRSIKVMIGEAVGTALLDLNMDNLSPNTHINLTIEHFKELNIPQGIGF